MSVFPMQGSTRSGTFLALFSTCRTPVILSKGVVPLPNWPPAMKNHQLTVFSAPSLTS